MEKPRNHFNTTQDLACQSEVKMNQGILNEILKSGLIVTGGKGSGKSNSVKVIISELVRTRKATVKIMDNALNWLFDFPLQHQLIGQETSLYNVDNAIYDLTMVDDPQEQSNLMMEIVGIDFHNLVRMKLLFNGQVVKWICYVIEEAHMVIGSHALRSRQNKYWLKAISLGRNIGQSFIFLTQRLSSVSSEAVERCNGYLFGKITGANDLRKVRAIAGKESSWLVKDLAVGSFYYYNGSEPILIKFPLFKSNTQPVEYKPQKQSWFKKWIYNGER